jgi:hypothetical protein
MVHQIEEGRILILVSKWVFYLILVVLYSNTLRLDHGSLLQSLIPGSYWVKGEDSTEEREIVFNLLIQSKNPKEVVISSR